MKSKEDCLALMRWENETGPTAGKNQRPGRGAAALNPHQPAKTSGKRGIPQGKLQKIPMVNMTFARTRNV